MTENNNIDGVLNYLVEDDFRTELGLKHPCRVVAYELTTTWDGKGEAPRMYSDGQMRFRVGEELKSFFQSRKDTKTNEWKLTQLWFAFAPFKEQEIYGNEGIPWE